MGRIAYVNGRFARHADAMVHIEDRGYQLADAVYEVWALFDGKLSDAEGHFGRLARSLGELSIPMPMSRAALTLLLKEAVRRNGVREGLIYLQVSRGVAPRQHDAQRALRHQHQVHCCLQRCAQVRRQSVRALRHAERPSPRARRLPGS